MLSANCIVRSSLCIAAAIGIGQEWSSYPGGSSILAGSTTHLDLPVQDHHVWRFDDSITFARRESCPLRCGYRYRCDDDKQERTKDQERNVFRESAAKEILIAAKPIWKMWCESQGCFARFKIPCSLHVYGRWCVEKFCDTSVEAIAFVGFDAKCVVTGCIAQVLALCSVSSAWVDPCQQKNRHAVQVAQAGLLYYKSWSINMTVTYLFDSLLYKISKKK